MTARPHETAPSGAGTPPAAPPVGALGVARARAEARGLVRGRAGWSRRLVNLVARAEDGRWWWAPESWRWADVLDHAPRFATEAEALTAACDWLDAGEPEVSRG